MVRVLVQDAATPQTGVVYPPVGTIVATTRIAATKLVQPQHAAACRSMPQHAAAPVFWSCTRGF